MTGLLERARHDVLAFSRLVEHPLTDWQASSLGLDSRITVIVAPRQSGKSRALALLAVWWAFRRPGQRVLIVSAGEDASRRLLSEVRRIVSGCKLLQASAVDEFAGLLTLSNGSEIRSVPASDRAIRGWSTDLLLIDEAALVSDDLLLDAAMPTTAARPDARVVMASSATSASGAFYDHAMRGEQGSEHVLTYRWRLTDATWISPSTIAAARESMSELRFRAEFEGEFAGSGDLLFPRSVLERAITDRPVYDLDQLAGPARLLGGQDWGATTDRSAFVAIGRVPGEPQFVVVCAKRWRQGHPLPAVIDELVSMPGHFAALSLERNGLGEGCVQSFAKAWKSRPADAGGSRRPPSQVLVTDDPTKGPTVVTHVASKPNAWNQGFHTWLRGVVTSAPLKAAVYSSVRLMVERQELLIPRDATDLLRELLLLRVDLTPTGEERIAASSGHDDLADALMLAATPDRGSDGRWHSVLERYVSRVVASDDEYPPGAYQSVADHRVTVPHSEPKPVTIGPYTYERSTAA